MTNVPKLSEIDQIVDVDVIPQIKEYIRIPCKSPAFDQDWAKNGFIHKAVNHIASWCRERSIEGLKLKVVELPQRTPILFMEIPSFKTDCTDTVLLYGHLDKQPEMEGWREDLGPWKPVIEDDKLYGRGGADDGYSAYASLLAIETLQKEGLPHARAVVIIEASEESGSPDLPAYIDHLKEEMGEPNLVICLDSGCGDYEHLWCTTSLRGLVTGVLTVEHLSEGVHSGDAGGIVPSTFRIARMLLSRIEDEQSGQVLLKSVQTEIPKGRAEEAQVSARALGEAVYSKFPFLSGAEPIDLSTTELILNRTWRAALEITGVAGIPPLERAGNVARPKTSLMLSLRVPPNADVNWVVSELKEKLLQNPPYGAKVEFEGHGNEGWNAPAFSSWLISSLNEASHAYFKDEWVAMGEGGSIPFMAMLGEKFPNAEFMITGVLGPASNAHGPNEFLHIPTLKRVTKSVALVLNRHANSTGTRTSKA